MAYIVKYKKPAAEKYYTIRNRQFEKLIYKFKIKTS